MFTQKDRYYMEMALALAEKGLGRTWPNPMVGAVIVKNGKIIGKGWHHYYGGPHAEINALRQAGAKAAGATLYLNLEPCSHFGQTPPCAQALIQAGIRRVLCAMKDPNPKVSGKGFAWLRKSGVRVEVGLLAKAAKKLNRVFIKRITTGLPFVVNKVALSLDGKIACANGASRWISSLPARQYAHRLRALSDAIIVGMGTVLADDPELNVRLAPLSTRKQPLRVLVEGRRKTPVTLKLFETCKKQNVIIATARSASASRRYPEGVQQWTLPGKNGLVDLAALLKRLGKAGVSFVLVEGGAEIHADFLGLGDTQSKILSDEIHFILAPKIIGGQDALGPIGGRGVDHPDQAVTLEDISWRALGPDLLVKARPRQKSE